MTAINIPQHPPDMSITTPPKLPIGFVTGEIAKNGGIAIPNP